MTYILLAVGGASERVRGGLPALLIVSGVIAAMHAKKLKVLWFFLGAVAWFGTTAILLVAAKRFL